MTPFRYVKVASPAEAIARISGHPDARFVAGATTLLDLMKLSVETPDLLIDINHIGLDRIVVDDRGLHIGAQVLNTDLAEHPAVKERWTVLSQAILAGASTQLRNMATAAGNLLQGNRCGYFRDTAMPCNRRKLGSGCGALGEQAGVEGINRYCAVLGTSPSCIAAHPSDMCVALVALDAQVRITGPNGERQVPAQEFFRLPGDSPQIQTVLRHDELIVGIDVPPPHAGARSIYLKVRDRTSYAYALTSAGVVLTRNRDGTIGHVGIALGGVGSVPWRAPGAEAVLRGKAPSDALFRKAAAAAFEGAAPYQYNGFKIALGQDTLIRVLNDLVHPGADNAEEVAGEQA
jgi:xanthine dehydrogenase YagS FAD-binding subunit